MDMQDTTEHTVQQGQTTRAVPSGKKDDGGFSRRNLLKGATVGGAVVVAAGATVGGVALFNAKSAPASTISSPGKLREYWVQADSFYHNLVPTGVDGMMGMTYKASDTSYWAIGYRAYTPNWGKPLEGNDDIGDNSGIPGPILRGSEDDTIRVHFRNNDTHYGMAHSMHPHGVFYSPDNDGGWFAADPRPGTVVKVGESYTYTWEVRSNSIGTWVYHDHSLPRASDMLMEVGSELGLVGFLSLTDSSVKPVDKEIFTFFHDLYQSDIPTLTQDWDCFNGGAYVGNTPTLHTRVGQKIRWHVGALGKEFHVFHLHGHRWLSETGRFSDTLLLGPSMASSFEFTEDNPGKWLYHCHVTDHMMGGMSGLYVVTQ